MPLRVIQFLLVHTLRRSYPVSSILSSNNLTTLDTKKSASTMNMSLWRVTEHWKKLRCMLRLSTCDIKNRRSSAISGSPGCLVKVSLFNYFPFTFYEIGHYNLRWRFLYVFSFKQDGPAIYSRPDMTFAVD